MTTDIRNDLYRRILDHLQPAFLLGLTATPERGDSGDILGLFDDHVAFRAESAEQQAEWREHLLSLGIAVSPVADRTYFESIYFRAPDGLLVEIATDGPGFTVDETAGRLGGDLKLPAWLEARRSAIEGSLVPLP